MWSAHPALGRRLLATAVVVFWLAMTAALAYRQWEARRNAREGTGAGDLGAPGESFMALELSGRKIGVIHTRRGPESRDGLPGFVMRTEAHLHLGVLAAPAELTLDATLWHALGAPKAAVEAELAAPGQRLRITGAVEEGELVGQLETAGAVIPLRTRVDPALLDPRGFLTTLPARGLAPGQELRMMGLDPLSLRPATMRLRSLGDEEVESLGARVKAHKVALTTGATTVVAWLDQSNELIRAELPLGLEVRSISAREAAAPIEASGAMDLIERVAVTPRGLTPHRGARRMVVRVAGLGEGVDLPVDDTQRRLAPDVWAVVRPAGPEAARGPSEGGRAASLPAAADLAAEPLVQSDQPRIRDQAVAIVGQGTDPWQRAQAIEAWVYRSLAKESAPGVPSALEVLATRRGDCNEHTVLFTALARAAGVPTRIAVGVVWSEELQAFGYHAWPEVYVGHWVWMDPTFGQDVADATHLKLLEGSISSWPQVMAFIGRLQLEVLELS